MRHSSTRVNAHIYLHTAGRTIVGLFLCVFIVGTLARARHKLDNGEEERLG